MSGFSDIITNCKISQDVLLDKVSKNFEDILKVILRVFGILKGLSKLLEKFEDNKRYFKIFCKIL